MLFLKLRAHVNKTYYTRTTPVYSLDFGIPAQSFLGEVPKNTQERTTKFFSFQPYVNVDIDEELIKIGDGKEVLVKTNKDLPVWTNIYYQFRVNPNCSSQHYHIFFDLIKILTPEEYKQEKYV